MRRLLGVIGGGNFWFFLEGGFFAKKFVKIAHSFFVHFHPDNFGCVYACGGGKWPGVADFSRDLLCHHKYDPGNTKTAGIVFG